MMNFLRKYQYRIFLFTMVAFLLPMVVGFVFYLIPNKRNAFDAVAEVDGENIPMRIFLSHYRRALNQAGPTITPEIQEQKKQEVLRDMVQGVVFTREAKRYGILVPDQQVVMTLTQTPAFQEKGAFNPRVYMEALQSQIRMSPKDFEEEQRKTIAFFKLRWLIQSSIKVTDRETEMLAAFQKKPLKTAKEKDEFRQQVWQQKVLYSFNEWFNRLGRDLKVKPYLDRVDKAR